MRTKLQSCLSLTACVTLVSPHPILDRMRFLFTMSDIERPEPSGPEPSNPAPRQDDAAALAARAPDQGTKPLQIASEGTAPLQTVDGRLKPEPPAPQDKASASSSPGGARRDRTDDLMLAKHALSQLSYGPMPTEAGRFAPSARSAARPTGRRASWREPSGRTSAPALEASKDGGPGRT